MRRVAVAAAVALAAVAAATAAYRWETRPPPVARGWRLAVALGCPACHDLAGGPGAPNPGSREGRVPGWGGGNRMMYFPRPGDVAAWIRDGAPRRYRESASFRERRQRQLLRMPAYRGHVDGADLEALVAYVEAVAEVGAPDTGPAAEGYAVAARAGCFRCHGPGGLGGIANPGSFAGFIPGWRGRGYRALVRDREELLAWIREGTVARFEHNPLARWILSRQRIRMPAYRDRLSGEELEAIAAYVAWLQGR